MHAFLQHACEGVTAQQQQQQQQQQQRQAERTSSRQTLAGPGGDCTGWGRGRSARRASPAAAHCNARGHRCMHGSSMRPHISRADRAFAVVGSTGLASPHAFIWSGNALHSCVHDLAAAPVPLHVQRVNPLGQPGVGDPRSQALCGVCSGGGGGGGEKGVSPHCRMRAAVCLLRRMALPGTRPSSRLLATATTQMSSKLGGTMCAVCISANTPRETALCTKGGSECLHIRTGRTSEGG